MRGDVIELAQVLGKVEELRSASLLRLDVTWGLYPFQKFLSATFISIIEKSAGAQDNTSECLELLVILEI